MNITRRSLFKGIGGLTASAIAGLPTAPVKSSSTDANDLDEYEEGEGYTNDGRLVRYTRIGKTVRFQIGGQPPKTVLMESLPWTNPTTEG